MKVVKKFVTLKKGKDEKRVKENSFAFFHLLGLGYLVVKSIPREIKDAKVKKVVKKEVEEEKQIEVKE